MPETRTGSAGERSSPFLNTLLRELNAALPKRWTAKLSGARDVITARSPGKEEFCILVMTAWRLMADGAPIGGIAAEIADDVMRRAGRKGEDPIAAGRLRGRLFARLAKGPGRALAREWEPGGIWLEAWVLAGGIWEPSPEAAPVTAEAAAMLGLGAEEAVSLAIGNTGKITRGVAIPLRQMATMRTGKAEGLPDIPAAVVTSACGAAGTGCIFDGDVMEKAAAITGTGKMHVMVPSPDFALCLPAGGPWAPSAKEISSISGNCRGKPLCGLLLWEDGKFSRE